MSPTEGTSADGPTEVINELSLVRPASQLRRNLEARLVTSLVEMPTLNSADGRAELTETLAHYMGWRLPLRDQGPSRLFFVQLVRQCADVRAGLTELAQAVAHLTDGEPGCDEVQRLVNQCEALEIEATLEEIWDDLRRELSKIPLADVQPLVIEVTQGRVGLPPKHCSGTWETFVYLIGQNTLPDQLPSWVAFLEIIRERFGNEEEDLNGTVRSYLRRVVRSWQSHSASEGLDRLRFEHGERHQPVLRAGVLTIEVAPTAPGNPDSVAVCAIQRWDDDESAPQRGPDILVSRGGLQTVVEHLVEAAEQDWAMRSADLRIEFLLPIALLNESVEWWPKDSQSPPMVPLAMYHSVVLRSLDRMQRRSWHRMWLRRWERLLQEPATSQVLWIEANRERHLSRLEAELMSDDTYVGVVLSAPPEADPQIGQEILVALRTGIPLILWHRSNCDNGFRQVAAELVLDRLDAVPQRLGEMRRQIESLESADTDLHPVREISLLWDDAYRIPHTVRPHLSKGGYEDPTNW
jgi:hypothetical protein